MKTTQFQLKNGLKVLLVESHKSPVVSVQMWVRTGSADETPSEAGISHFIEHLVFKGTNKFGVGEIASTVEGAGGELNAYTSFDQTVFYVTVAKAQMKVGLEVISEMMGFPRFDPQEIDNEREVVIEEIKRGEDSPHRQASQLLFKTAFKKHNYGVPVIGYADIIRNVSVQKIKKYYQDRYSPRNMFLVVAGNFETTEMKKFVQEYFLPFKDNKIRKVKRKKEPVQTKARLAIKSTPFKENLLYLSWKIPNVKHKDVPALDVLAMILGQGESSRLVQSLRIEKPIANSVGAFTFTPQDEGIFAFSAGLHFKNIESLFAGFLSALEKIKSEPPTAQELQKAVTNLASEQVYSLETVDGIASKVGGLEFYMKNPNYFPQYLKQVYALTPQKISEVARKYLIEKTVTLAMTTELPKEVEGLAKKFMSDLKKSEKKKLQLQKKKEKFKVKKFSIKNSKEVKETHPSNNKTDQGMGYLIKKQSETPTVSLRIGFLGGLRIEDPKKIGTSELFSRTWLSGTKNRTEFELSSQVDQMAASFSAFSGRNSVGLSFDFLSPYQDEVADLVEDVLFNSLWPNEALEREKSIINHQIKSQQDNPSQVCMSLFAEKMFEGHPYSFDPLGTEETSAANTQDGLKAYFERIFSNKNMTLSLVGDVNESYWKKKIIEWSKKMPVGQRELSNQKILERSQEQRFFKKIEREQSHIILGHRGLTLSDPDRFTLHVIQAILAGQGGRLFLELRDKNSLAYSVSPLKMEGVDTGYFGAYIGCSPEKSSKAISMMKEEFSKLATTRVGDEELRRAKKYISGKHCISMQRKSAVCNAMLFDAMYGLNPEESLHIDEKYESVTADKIISLSQKIFSTPALICTVGKHE